MFNSKQREIKLIRQVYEECLKVTQNDSGMFDPSDFDEGEYASLGKFSNI
jgi:hypothetical protein